MIAVNWMPKYYKSKDCNPYDPNISISTQIYQYRPNTQIEWDFHAQYLKRKIPITKYSNILKSTKT
jgi:hypothetical protein